LPGDTGAPKERPVMTLSHAVYPGSEKLDLGRKRPAVLCESLAQANHMKTFWGEHGYVELLQTPIEISPEQLQSPTRFCEHGVPEGKPCCGCEMLQQ
jgi:hypothetical protein